MLRLRGLWSGLPLVERASVMRTLLTLRDLASSSFPVGGRWSSFSSLSSSVADGKIENR